MKPIKGLITALVTPFTSNGKIDFGSIEKLLAQQLAGGVDGFVVNGTTGESPNLEQSEVKSLYDFVRKNIPSSKVVIVGTGSNSTARTVEFSKLASSWGPDALLVVVPYYNKPPQRGLYEHFKAVAESTDARILLYNVPGRTITSLHSDTVASLSEIKNIIGIKEASGDLNYFAEIMKKCRPGFVFLSGDDATSDQFQRLGGHGVISVSSHIIPKQMKELRTDEYKSLVDGLFIEANPIPVKKALQLMGLIASAEVRLPLVSISKENELQLAKLLQNAKLI